MVNEIYTYHQETDMLELSFPTEYTHNYNINITNNVTLEIDKNNKPRMITITDASSIFGITKTVFDSIIKLYFNVITTESNIIIKVELTSADAAVYQFNQTIENTYHLESDNNWIKITL